VTVNAHTRLSQYEGDCEINSETNAIGTHQLQFLASSIRRRTVTRRRED